MVDGGPCSVGVESTILDLTCEPPRLLRPGGLSLESLERLIGHVDVDKAVIAPMAAGEQPKAPGMKYRHYAPKGKLIVTDAGAQQLCNLVNTAAAKGHKVGLIVTSQMEAQLSLLETKIPAEVLCLGDRRKPEELAANLFGALRGADEQNLEVIYGEALSRDGVGEAIMNRFLKASSDQLWLNQ